ncbi:hypothetical protein vBBak6_101 [Bacillus phage v_B-Bak6]|uniref:Uncharacterized protein n=2 Tax=Basiliskvirus TaxID=3044670 RepID=A0A385IK71_9CAUD|nr:hypothetical protein PP653_gp055 [Bacillus phage Basilisk]YP_010657004.1 hypothetical protein PP654_gp045 [Bacillus phage v_B-Bak10]AXY83061.1 hypothetical protein vBBak1_101 [Bacillus phage v_B-Bak1]AXY83181.1 hypothetical protein vBBak6_101 [Bacillus phage v_B-Bak6]AGR46650.1 hypothetical protein BASILISK_112 [Bacillus phage Basilisk]AXY83295.1 hypothetical protein vBBBak10_097 [Bacillus phage v_B-Bak10]
MKDVKFVDNETFKTIAEDEGLYYAVMDYVDPNTIENASLRQKVVAARYYMNVVKDYIERDDNK